MLLGGRFTLLSRNGKTVMGIVGLGVVGDAVHHYFKTTDYPLRLFDLYKGLGSPEEINEADVIFICVPTPYQAGTGFDASALEDAIGRIEGSKVIVIKSTVLPGTTESFQVRYPQHRFLFNPEFLRQDYARAEFLKPDRQIVGFCAESRHLAESVLSLLPDAPYRRVMLAREAELTKYMANSFLALKVTFANEFFDLASALDIDYEVVRESVSADVRIGESHMYVAQDGYRGYGGKCLPKDTKAVLDLAERLGLPLHLMRTADRVNATLLPPSEQPPSAPQLIPISSNDEFEEIEADERVDEERAA